MNATPQLLGGRYEVGALLGRGGMAEVHMGRDTRLGRSVAIKMLRTDLARDPSFQNRFRREAQSAAALNHPAIVAVYDSGEEPVMSSDTGQPSLAVPYIVMEYVEGHTLRDVIKRGQPLPWEEALRITSGVLAALAYSHRANIVHRDIKPANVMLTPSGEVKVMDFGIARALADSSATMTQTQAVIGTAQYLSPEQARGETVDARSDIYSAGCLLFELLTGRPPFVADSPVAVAYQHVGEAPKPPSDFEPSVPGPVDAIVLHALTKDRDERYQSADEFRDDLKAALAGRRISSAALGSAAGAGAVAAGATTPSQPTERIAPARETEAPATQALGPIALPADPTSQLPTVGDGYGRYDPADPTLRPADGRGPQKANRTGLWVLLALLAAAIIALAVLVLPGLLGGSGSQKAQVAVPSITGQTEAQARTTLSQHQLTAGTVTKETSDTVPEGQVVSQSPPEGTMLIQGGSVDFVVSSGKGEVIVPDLTGMTVDQAKKALADEGLTLGKQTESDSPDQRKGRVISSSPSTGESVAKDTPVDIEVASGKVRVPNVVGQSLEDATKTLTDAGLAVTAEKFEESTQPQGTVIKQDPASGLVDQGTKVVLVRAKPPATPTTTPPETPTTTTSPPGDGG
ncbi:MAG TPA: Stk1 family PASTA domain-containing Ser/Thr kinase [Actinomycetales bacterium]|nr:Stk1 family PASTA domain-containing Ser/Thr kinase [Actinomycetales bacterium]